MPASLEDEIAGRLSAYEFALEVLLANWFHTMPAGTPVQVAEHMMQLQAYVRGKDGVPEDMRAIDKACNDTLSNLLEKAIARERTLAPR